MREKNELVLVQSIKVSLYCVLLRVLCRAFSFTQSPLMFSLCVCVLFAFGILGNFLMFLFFSLFFSGISTVSIFFFFWHNSSIQLIKLLYLKLLFQS